MSEKYGSQIVELLGPYETEYRWDQVVDGISDEIEDINESWIDQLQQNIQSEVEFIENQVSKATSYIGDAIIIDGEPLGDVCPFFGLSVGHISPVELTETRTIASLAA